MSDGSGIPGGLTPCRKISYPDVETATWYKPFREQRLGVTLWPYRCPSRACKPWGRWHLTSKGDVRARKAAARRARRAERSAELARWYDDGGMNPALVNRQSAAT
ncbi:hypothetical protein [Actinacidiphila acididurans]|uniref:Uncharacterized protein n=1 Tax=Actinacidiphila acididurans TaxID=2784346 RepID=A0ABS2U680_9ACTN|nr:hypothetical protein [Actinacidiphila acididurans]MBM9510005.1 hypothetical protein [Actinacidiphila acididurans]